MHDKAYHEMKILLDSWMESTTQKVAELGSWNVGGPSASLRNLMHSNWEYVGFDIRGSAEYNVNTLMPGVYKIPVPDNTFDAMMSVNTLEHSRNPFKLVAEAARVVKPGGKFFFCAPFIHAPHDHFDAWRFLPKGMRMLFEEAGVRRLNSYLRYHNGYISAYKSNKENVRTKKICDCWYIGVKDGSDN